MSIYSLIKCILWATFRHWFCRTVRIPLALMNGSNLFERACQDAVLGEFDDLRELREVMSLFRVPSLGVNYQLSDRQLQFHMMLRFAPLKTAEASAG